MGKPADLTVVQWMIINTLHKGSKPQKVIAKKDDCLQSAESKQIYVNLTGREKCDGKRCTNNRENSSKRLFKNFTGAITHRCLISVHS